MAFRSRSAERVIEESGALVEQTYRRTDLIMADNIMPHRLFLDAAPAARDELPGLHIFYEQKANLSLSSGSSH